MMRRARTRGLTWSDRVSADAGDSSSPKLRRRLGGRALRVLSSHSPIQTVIRLRRQPRKVGLFAGSIESEKANKPVR
jgi:hypothetical protein